MALLTLEQHPPFGDSAFPDIRTAVLGATVLSNVLSMLPGPLVGKLHTQLPNAAGATMRSSPRLSGLEEAIISGAKAQGTRGTISSKDSLGAWRAGLRAAAQAFGRMVEYDATPHSALTREVDYKAKRIASNNANDYIEGDRPAVLREASEVLSGGPDRIDKMAVRMTALLQGQARTLPPKDAVLQAITYMEDPAGYNTAIETGIRFWDNEGVAVLNASASRWQLAALPVARNLEAILPLERRGVGPLRHDNFAHGVRTALAGVGIAVQLSLDQHR